MPSREQGNYQRASSWRQRQTRHGVHKAASDHRSFISTGLRSRRRQTWRQRVRACKRALMRWYLLTNLVINEHAVAPGGPSSRGDNMLCSRRCNGGNSTAVEKISNCGGPVQRDSQNHHLWAVRVCPRSHVRGVRILTAPRPAGVWKRMAGGAARRPMQPQVVRDRTLYASKFERSNEE